MSTYKSVNLTLDSNIRSQFKRNLCFSKFYNVYKKQHYLYALTSCVYDGKRYGIVIDISDSGVDDLTDSLFRDHISLTEVDLDYLQEDILKQLDSMNCTACAFLSC